MHYDLAQAAEWVRSTSSLLVFTGAGISTESGIHHPSLVLFGDSPAQPAWTNAQKAAHACDVLLQVGCSGVVMPAATLPWEAKSKGAHIIAVDPSPADADLWLRGNATEVVPELFRAAFGG